MKYNLYDLLLKFSISIIIALIAQTSLIKIFELKNIDMISLLNNIFFVFLIIEFNHLSKQVKWFLILFLFIINTFNFFVLNKYLGQDILFAPFTFIGHLTTNMHKLQYYDHINYKLNKTLISLDDETYNFWYEYYHFKHGNDLWYCWLLPPGKYDDYINFQLYKGNVVNFTTEIVYKDVINKKHYTFVKEDEYQIVEINKDNLYYKLILDMKNKGKYLEIITGNVNIKVKSNKWLITESYCPPSIFRYYSPIIPSYLIRFGGITDIYPYENLDDAAIVTDASVTINNVTDNNAFSWFDRYTGNGYYFMSNYIWTVHYSKNWNIFILFYTDYPYNTGVCVSYFFNKETNKMIDLSNFFPFNIYNNPLTGTKCSINTNNKKLVDKEFEYKVNYESPKISCNIESIRLCKPAENIKIYKRYNNHDKYGDGEELHKITEELVYNEFAGKSRIQLKYNNIDYDEESWTVVDGVDWENGKNGPDCYKKKELPFFQNKFYVKSPFKDKYNGKILDCIN
tara:strand:- start:2101 stop:3633 length:1533 start_codon:yes stop_codon:yes gene_type:complete